MDTKNLDLLCMSCFSELPDSRHSVLDTESPAVAHSTPCPVCGYIEGVAAAAAPHHLPIRTILNGKYLVGKVLGEGGFGITYIGNDLNLEIKVAIKEYFPSGFATRTSTVSESVQPHAGDTDGVYTQGRERFVNEAKRLARFRVLPGIVMVNDFFTENGTAYIVMEYVEGVTLKAYLAQQGGRLPVEQVLTMLAPVFASLAQVHGSGIIHRDISPDNIMITTEGTVKLLDFGAAREFSESGNKSLSVLLKHGYAPTEQYSSKGKQGPHTDVYALAATIYKAITGVTPENAMDRILDDTMLPPSGHGIDIEPHQETALMKALAVRTEHRYQTVGEFYNELMGEPAANVGDSAQSVADGELRVPQNAETPPQSPKTPSVIASTAPIVSAGDIGDVAKQSPQISRHSVLDTESPESPQGIAGQSVSLRSRARNDDNSNKRGTPIIAAAVAAVVIAGVILALTLPGSGEPDEDSTTPPTAEIAATPATETPVITSTPTPVPTPSPTPTPEASRGYSVVGVGVNSRSNIQKWGGKNDFIEICLGAGGIVGLKFDGTVDVISYHEFEDTRNWTDIVAISASEFNIVGLKADGTVVAETALINDNVGRDVSDWRDIVAVSANNNYTIGLKSDGSVVWTGRGYYHLWGVEDWTDIVEISAGDGNIVGLKSDGTVRHGSDYVETNISQWRDIVAISAHHHILGLKSDGTVVVEGNNYYGECDVSDWRDIVAISALGNQSVGLKSDGTVVAVGRNDNGECNVSGWRNVMAIASGYQNTVALVGNGEPPPPRPTLPLSRPILPGAGQTQAPPEEPPTEPMPDFAGYDDESEDERAARDAAMEDG